MKKLSPSGRQMFYMLLSKYKNFFKKDRLAKDGSFYYDDKRLAQELYLSVRTIQRSKKCLIEQGHIKAEIGKCKGWATKYWIVPKGDKMSPFEEVGKGDKLSAKDDILSFKGCQTVYPNKVIIKKENKGGDGFENQDLRNLTEEQKQGIRAAVPFLKGEDRVIEFYCNLGYDRDVLEQVFREPVCR